jgi:hypothetical protein
MSRDFRWLTTTGPAPARHPSHISSAFTVIRSREIKPCARSTEVRERAGRASVSSLLACAVLKEGGAGSRRQAHAALLVHNDFIYGARNNDIWDCVPDGDDIASLGDGCVRIATLNDLDAE